MTLVIRTISEDDYREAFEFQQKYSDKWSYDEFLEYVKANVYIAAFEEGRIVGIIFGHPSDRNNSEFVLQGVAADLDNGMGRKGIGSALIAEFEKAVINRGYHKVGLGAADDLKVEKFYLKNGYYPVELVVNDSEYNEIARVRVEGYDKELQEELREKHKARQVIFIFEKSI